MGRRKSRLGRMWDESAAEWRKRQESGFAERVLSVDPWIEAGDKILRGADLVRPVVDAWWNGIRDADKATEARPPGDYLADIYYMLLGFAAENYLKAALVQRNRERLERSLRDTAELPEVIRSHNLGAAVKELHVPVDEEEAWLLEILEARAVWAGRYPFPTRASDEDFGTGADSQGWVEKARALVLRLREQVRHPS